MISGKADFLLAMPSLKESVFAHSVILMTEQTDDGALGFIVNVSTGTNLHKALDTLDIKLPRLPDVPILFGGPVQTEFFWFLHSTDFQAQSTIKIHQTFFLSSAIEIIPLLNEEKGPQIFYSGVGYAGWGPGQLDREIEEGSWWRDNFDVDLLFGTHHAEQWSKAFSILGVDPNTLVDRSTPSNPIIN
ncbi:MAG: YqgE/AlgH family protein [Proteobacteria bacterium]|nr:YqgE/AlgH family protein [Pseudomonadota bacterium]